MSWVNQALGLWPETAMASVNKIEFTTSHSVNTDLDPSSSFHFEFPVAMWSQFVGALLDQNTFISIEIQRILALKWIINKQTSLLCGLEGTESTHSGTKVGCLSSSTLHTMDSTLTFLALALVPGPGPTPARPPG